MYRARSTGNRQVERSELSTRRLLDVIAELGYERTTLAEIGERRLDVDVQPDDLAELTLNALRGLAYRRVLDQRRVDFDGGLTSLRAYLTRLAAPSGADHER